MPQTQCCLSSSLLLIHICIGNLTIIGSDNGLSPGRRQAIIWTNAGILLIGPLIIKFSDILITVNTFSSKITQLKMSVKWGLFCLSLNALKGILVAILKIQKPVWSWYLMIHWHKQRPEHITLGQTSKWGSLWKWRLHGKYLFPFWTSLWRGMERVHFTNIAAWTTFVVFSLVLTHCPLADA